MIHTCTKEIKKVKLNTQLRYSSIGTDSSVATHGKNRLPKKASGLKSFLSGMTALRPDIPMV